MNSWRKPGGAEVFVLWSRCGCHCSHCGPGALSPCVRPWAASSTSRTREEVEAPGGLEPGRHSRAKCPSRLRGLGIFTLPFFPLYLKFAVKFTLILVDKHLESWSPFYSWPEKSGPTPGCPVYPLPQPGRLQTSFPEVSHWGPAWEGHVQPAASGV